MRELALPANGASLDNAAVALVGGPYSARTAGEIMTMERRESTYLLPTVPVCEYGASAAFVGEPGLGKSRFVLQLLAAQAAGLGTFCGIPLDPTPRKTLFIQSENSLPRLQKDLSGFTRAGFLTDAQFASLSTHLVTTTLETDLDGDIAIDDTDPEGGNFVRLQALIGRHRPEVVVFDPWAGVCAEETVARSIRISYLALRRACRGTDCGPITLILLCHAKPGIAARASARGADALSYCRGNRTLIGIMRAVINMRPCEYVTDDPVDAKDATADGPADAKDAPSDGPRVRLGIEIIWAKSNNGVLPDPVAVWLNPETFVYERIADFNHQAWQESLERQAKSGSAQSSVSKAVEAARALTATHERVQNLLTKTGPLVKAELTGKLVELGIASSKRGATDTIKWLVAYGQVIMHQPRPNRAALYMTPAQAQAQEKGKGEPRETAGDRT